MPPEPRPAAMYVAFDVFPRAKGSSSHIASMVRGLQRRFGRVRLLCLGGPDLPAFQIEGGIEIHRFFQPRKRDLLARATAFARFVAAHTAGLRGALRLAVFRDPWGGYPLLRSAPGCPVIFEVNALPSWELAYSRPGFAGNAALRAKLADMERRCLREAARVLCVSSVTRRALIGEGVPAEKIDVIPNVAHDVFFTGADAVPAPPLLEEHGECDWFGYAGGLQSWQGVHTVLDAFALIAGDLPRARLLVLRGDSRADLRALERRIARHRLGGQVVVHPPVEQPAVAAMLPRLRFTVAPLADTPRNTTQGCCPVKLVESMAAGVPVIASDLAVCREWIDDGVDGRLVEAGDVRGWALALRHWLQEADGGRARRRMGAAARSRAERCFSWRAVHAALDRVFALGGGQKE